MRFDSKSVLLNGGSVIGCPINPPTAFGNYKFSPNVLQEAVDEFNRKLDGRLSVTMNIDKIKIDVLNIGVAGNNLFIRLVVVENNRCSINQILPNFTIKGDVYFNGDSDVNVDKIVIKDVIFGGSGGVFSEKS